eukprot:10589225-Alexandrium_andersonii.AAC.1
MMARPRAGPLGNLRLNDRARDRSTRAPVEVRKSPVQICPRIPRNLVQYAQLTSPRRFERVRGAVLVLQSEA